MLTDVKVAKLKYDSRAPGQLERHTDRDGLYLAVSPPHKTNPKATYGSKVWRYDYRWPPSTSGKRQTLTYGRYPELTLAQARDKHLEARRAIAAGLNPVERKQEVKRAQLAAAGNTYEIIAGKWFEAEKKDKSQSWIENNERWLKLVNKTLGQRTIGSITDHDDIYRALRPLEDEGFAFSADRARQQIAQVFIWAIKKRLHKGLNPAQELKGEIKVPKTTNHRHIKVKEIPEFLIAVDASKRGTEQTKIAAKLLLLTIVRKQELAAAKRSELDLENAVWEIPAERMKNGFPHIVPLSSQAVALFKRQLEIAGKGDYIFPSLSHPGDHMGLSTLNAFFGRIGFGDRLTPHGLRSVASTELNGIRKFCGDPVERQLAHKEPNKQRAAYDKSTHLELRKEMMQHWADFTDRLCQGTPQEQNVIQMPARAA